MNAGGGKYNPPEVEGMPIPKGKTLGREVDKWRAIAYRWGDYHFYVVEEAGDIPAKLPRRCDGLLLMNTRREMIGRAKYLINHPPKRLVDELIAWRKLGRISLICLKKMRLTCPQYIAWMEKADALLR